MFDPAEFADVHKGATANEIVAALDAETDLIRLPQVFHTTSGASFSPELRQFADDENCAVAHAFDGATYTDANEIVWMVAKIESKLAAGVELTRLWLDRLEAVARRGAFLRVQIWLIANEGFDEEAGGAVAGPWGLRIKPTTV